MRSFALLASFATVIASQFTLAEQVPQGFAPACSNAACPHPVAEAQAQTLHQVGPRLFAPVLNAAADAPAPAPIRDFEVRVASNDVASANKDDRNALLQDKLSEVARLQYEIQQLRAELGQNQQILVKVKMLEVSLTKLNKLGVGISTAQDGRFAVMDSAGLRKLIETSSKTTSEDKPNNQPLGNPGTFTDWLMANNIGRVLAQPNLVVVSGRPAQFFCGTEIPVPERDGTGAAVEFQKCGTEVDVVAFSMNDNRVRLELRARVSERDDRHSIRVDNSSIPALHVRQCDTAVETKFGQPVVLNGMVEKRVDAVKTDGVEREEENEIALVLVVTPELVELPKSAEKPVRAVQTK
jgi:Flp pilus assembly secretin CpaC